MVQCAGSVGAVLPCLQAWQRRPPPCQALVNAGCYWCPLQLSPAWKSWAVQPTWTECEPGTVCFRRRQLVRMTPSLAQSHGEATEKSVCDCVTTEVQPHRCTEELQDNPSRSISGQTLAKTGDWNVGFVTITKTFHYSYTFELRVLAGKCWRHGHRGLTCSVLSVPLMVTGSSVDARFHSPLTSTFPPSTSTCRGRQLLPGLPWRLLPFHLHGKTLQTQEEVPVMRRTNCHHRVGPCNCTGAAPEQ